MRRPSVALAGQAHHRVAPAVRRLSSDYDAELSFPEGSLAGSALMLPSGLLPRGWQIWRGARVAGVRVRCCRVFGKREFTTLLLAQYVEVRHDSGVERRQARGAFEQDEPSSAISRLDH